MKFFKILPLAVMLCLGLAFVGCSANSNQKENTAEQSGATGSSSFEYEANPSWYQDAITDVDSIYYLKGEEHRGSNPMFIVIGDIPAEGDYGTAEKQRAFLKTDNFDSEEGLILGSVEESTLGEYGCVTGEYIDAGGNHCKTMVFFTGPNEYAMLQYVASSDEYETYISDIDAVFDSVKLL